MRIIYFIIEIYLILLGLTSTISGLSFLVRYPAENSISNCLILFLVSTAFFWCAYKIHQKRKNYIPPAQQRFLTGIQNSIAEATAQRDELLREIQDLQNTQNSLNEEIESLYKETVVPMTHIADYEDLRSDEIKNNLVILRGKQDDMIHSGSALNITNTGSKKVINSQVKQILRCFNAECTNIFDC